MMKKIFIALLLPFCALATFAQTKTTKSPAKKTTAVKSKTTHSSAPALNNTLDSASYAIGMSMAGGMKNDGLDKLNYDMLVRGLKDVFEAKPLLIKKENAQPAIGNLFKGLSKKKFAANIAEGNSFLENNKKQPGVQVTPSGLQYTVIKAGEGIRPKATDTVLVHYKGTLLNGKQFDSSYDRNEPLSLSLSNVIPGWTEGVQLMQTGAKYKFFIPYQLAYGERGAGADIPPFSTLIFDIELIKVNGK